MTAPRFEPVDSSQLLRLSSDAARVVMGLFMFSNILYTFATIDEVQNPAPVILAMVLVNAAAVLLVLERPDPFPMLLTIVVVAAVAISTVLVAFQLPDAGPPGRASWHLGSNTWMLFFLAMRRRPGAAWIGYVLMAAGTLAWSTSVDRGVVEGVLLLDTHAAILFVATLFEVNLRRTARRINEFGEHSVASAVEAAEGATSAQIRQRRVRELRASAVPLLERIVDHGPPQTEVERLRYATSEALLRDGVRGRSLMTPKIATAATRARERGVEVTLLDDRGQGLDSGEAMVRMSAAVIDELDAAESGSVTVRLAPQGRPIAVSIVTSGERGRVELDATGQPVSIR
ncbi:hypothetical protein LGT39_06340 [Demequina sp. TTPB684]|uniref:hypothetical protein n=1 Tax=unclassified Demequina TaxID=2620311 RepID=UPI001CF4B374|nr:MULTISPECIES: hypothetical protein [unclassified Demequina]MCB2412468.1 hypothetical protein [Demequina sp. TTPB684]UPU87699.1 hypothetical protein LGT36_010605 [Demequina sp. TMPB413]